MFTFRFFRNPKNNAVHLRITHNRRKAEMELGISATEEAFESALSDKPKTQYSYLASTLKGIDTKIREVQMDFLRDGGIPADMDAKDIREIVRERIFPGVALERINGESEETDDSNLFGKFYEKRMNAKANKGYKVSIEYTFKKMQAFCADKHSDHCKPFDELTFDDISLKWLNAFDEWLIITQGSAQNSRNIHFKNIRTVINRAIDEELTDKYPFRRFKIRPEATRKRSLSVKELRILFNYPVEEYQKFYLDMFRLMIMLCGINSTDLYNLTEITNGRIEYRRAKTHKLYSIKVEPEAMVIINRWKGRRKLLCIADRWKDPKDFNKNMNIALKKIGKHEQVSGRGGKIRITPLFPTLSTYHTRHSWATIAYNDCGVSKDVISQALGHSLGSTVTEIYLNKDQRLVDEANRKVLDYVFNNK